MAFGDSAIFSATATQTARVNWETDYIGSHRYVAWNSLNYPCYKAVATGAVVHFKDESFNNPRKVDGMCFSVAGSPFTPVPGNGASVPVGNTGLSVRNV